MLYRIPPSWWLASVDGPLRSAVTVLSWVVAWCVTFSGRPQENSASLARRHGFCNTRSDCERLFEEGYQKITSLWQKGGEETEELAWLECRNPLDVSSHSLESAKKTPFVMPIGDETRLMVRLNFRLFFSGFTSRMGRLEQSKDDSRRSFSFSILWTWKKKNLVGPRYSRYNA